MPDGIAAENPLPGGSFCKKRARMCPGEKHKPPASPSPRPGPSRTHGAKPGEAETKCSPKASLNLFNPRQLSFAQPPHVQRDKPPAGHKSLALGKRFWVLFWGGMGAAFFPLFI